MITFDSLFLLGFENDDEDEKEETEKTPITLIGKLDEPPYEHIHGRLTIAFSGRMLPYLGFFGPDDVCFNTWLYELSQIVTQLSKSPNELYIFDEGEQGQPAYLFERENDWIFVSIIESQLTGTEGDPDWQRISCRYVDFNSEVKRFFNDFRQHLFEQIPDYAAAWWENAINYG